MKIKRILAIVLTIAMVMSLCAMMASAADGDYSFDDTVIDPLKKGSIEIYKFDLTAAKKAGVWDETDGQTPNGTAINPDLLDPTKTGNLIQFAIQGVVYSYYKVANVVTYSEQENGVQKTTALYEINDTTGADFLTALGLSTADAYNVVPGSGASGFTPATGCHYYTSDTLVNALRTGLQNNSTTVKNALEAYLMAQGTSRQTFPETDANGHTQITNQDLGLYLVVETEVPENVVSTTDPFLVALPMTSVNGGPEVVTNNDGGTRWIYDVKIFPKNLTGDPDIKKTVREAAADTATWDNNGTANSPIDDGYADTATASAGDKVEYQVISHMPVITSDATGLTNYTFVDTLGKGIEYNGNAAANTAGLLNGHYSADDVVIKFYKDAACTTEVTDGEWHVGDTAPKFNVVYAAGNNGATVMTITMTEAGLNVINKTGSYSNRPMLEQGFSQLYMRITYSGTLNQNADLVLGDAGNPNDITLSWQRSNVSLDDDSQPKYIDTLADEDTTVYSYGVDLTKTFSDGSTDKFRDVKFKLYNVTDDYYVEAAESGSGVWYVTGHSNAGASGTADATAEAGGTMFIPAATTGELVIYGLEPDEYDLREMETSNGYTLLKDPIRIVINAPISTNAAVNENAEGHTYILGNATVDGDVRANSDMTDGFVDLTVINQKGFDLPKTGGNGTLMYAILGTALGCMCAIGIFFIRKKKKEEDYEEE